MELELKNLYDDFRDGETIKAYAKIIKEKFCTFFDFLSLAMFCRCLSFLGVIKNYFFFFFLDKASLISFLILETLVFLLGFLLCFLTVFLFFPVFFFFFTILKYKADTENT